MAPSSNHVRVPKPSPDSFNKERPITKNALLENQVKHFYELEQKLLEQLRTGIQYEDVRTEGDAAQYIRRMTTIFHPHLAKGAGK